MDFLHIWQSIYIFALKYHYYGVMSTISINQNIYNDAVIYARKHNVSIDTLVERFFISLLSNDISKQKEDKLSSSNVKYKISPRVKALEMGYICPENLSIDYKEEIKDGRMRKG